jgi:prepilin-type N-terminal cleavage/methylation domain-containing protein
MRTERGFSLIELLIVVAIIGLIAVIAVPGLVRARQYAQSGSAIQSVRTITTAEMLFIRIHKKYGTLLELAPEGTIDDNLQIGLKSGYAFNVQVWGIETDTQDKKRFEVTAAPIVDPAKSTYFFTDETAVIRAENGAPATAASSPIPR